MPHKKSKVEPELSFPDAPDFISRPPDLSLLEMIKLNESMLRYWNEKRYEEGSYYLRPIDFEPFSLAEEDLKRKR
jgi:hypothetical protein